MLRAGAETFAVRPQDYIVNLPGGAEAAHQLINTGDEDLVYLAISTLRVPEVVGYPDSGRTGVRTESGAAPEARFLLKDSDKNSVGYWDGRGRCPGHADRQARSEMMRRSPERNSRRAAWWPPCGRGVPAYRDRGIDRVGVRSCRRG